MTTADGGRRKRRAPHERRAEIVHEAMRVGLDEGLERITLRRVAEGIGVRPGLINHYFPEVDELVAVAFSEAVSVERAAMFLGEEAGTPLERLAVLLEQVLTPDNADYSRLWLNARIVGRYNAALRRALAQEEATNRELLAGLIRAGVEHGQFTCDRPERSALLILLFVDATSTYANEDVTEVTPLVATLLFETAEREFGLTAGELATRVSDLMAASGAPKAPVEMLEHEA